MGAIEIPFDGIITLLVFLVGVPAFVVQFMSPEVRRVVFEKGKPIPKEVLVALLFSIFIVGLSISIAIINMENFVHYVWITMFVLLGGVVILTTYLVQSRYGQRENVIKRLADKVVIEMQSSNGRLGGDTLINLIDIGKQSEPGPDKEMVLQALWRIANDTCAHEEYKGNTLSFLIAGVVEMLAIRPAAEDLQNYKTAVAIMKIILAEDTQERFAKSLVDQQHAVRALSALSQTVLSQINLPIRIESILMGFEEALELAVYRHPKMITDVTQAFWETGAVAVQSNNILFAMASMERLITIVEEPPTLPRKEVAERMHIPFEALADMLGLAAHFWTAGDSCKKFIKTRLDRIESILDEPLNIVVQKAQNHCMMTMEFDTADKLAQMEKEL